MCQSGFTHTMHYTCFTVTSVVSGFTRAGEHVQSRHAACRAILTRLARTFVDIYVDIIWYLYIYFTHLVKSHTCELK